MTIEQKELFRFIVAQAPFTELAPAATEYFIAHLQVVYISRENQHQWLNTAEPNLYLIRSGSFDLIEPSGELVARLSEGDYFGYPSLLTGDEIKNRLQVQTDGIVYLLNQESFDFLRHQYK